MTKRTIYVNVYNPGGRNYDGSYPPDYDGKMAFRTEQAATNYGRVSINRFNWKRVERRQVTEEQFKTYILSEEWSDAEG
jgi:hypothetical protein